MNKLRIGFVGCGVMGVRHIADAQSSPFAEAVAVADVLPERAASAAKSFGIRRVYRDGREVIADPEVDAVVFATATAHRDELVVEAIRASKHVLIEKPAAMRAEVIKRMIDARGDRVVASCSSRFHVYQSARIARDFLATGALGRLRLLHCRVYEGAAGAPDRPPPAWRLRRSLNGGGIFVNWGSYDLDFLLGVCGWAIRPRVVLAGTWPIPGSIASYVPAGSDAETHVAAFIRCEDGVIIQYERGEYMPARTLQAWQIVGENGSLDLTMTWKEGKVIRFDELTAAGVTSREIWRGDDTWQDAQGFVMRDFIESVVEGREPSTTLEKALVIQRIFDAVYRSAETGSPQSIVSD